MPLHKRNCLTRESVRQVFLLIYFLGPAQDGVKRPKAGVNIRVTTVKKTEKLVKAALEGMEMRVRSQMPLADHARDIP